MLVDHYAVPVAAGVVGWILGARLVTWILGDAGSSPTTIADQGVAAVILFLVARRYL